MPINKNILISSAFLFFFWMFIILSVIEKTKGIHPSSYLYYLTLALITLLLLYTFIGYKIFKEGK